MFLPPLPPHVTPPHHLGGCSDGVVNRFVTGCWGLLSRRFIPSQGSLPMSLLFLSLPPHPCLHLLKCGATQAVWWVESVSDAGGWVEVMAQVCISSREWGEMVIISPNTPTHPIYPHYHHTGVNTTNNACSPLPEPSAHCLLGSAENPCYLNRRPQITR